MPELLIELFSEEIPARMQARAAEDLCGLLRKHLEPSGLDLPAPRMLYGPRRIGVVATLAARTPETSEELRGPRQGAPRAAVEGFVGSKLPASADIPGDVDRLMRGEPVDVLAAPMSGGVPTAARIAWEDTGKGVFLVARIRRDAIPTAAVLERVLPQVIRLLPWPKSMRWGSSAFTWVRPLQRVLCVFDGAPVPFALAHGDDAHGLIAGNQTEGHRILAGTEPFAVQDAAGYLAGLRERFVIAEAAERERVIAEGIAALAAAEGLEVVADRGLLAEVAGLVEWPVPLLGRIDDAFMDLPAEVMRTTMRVNQRYFSLRFPDGRPAPRFAVVANIVPADGGAAIVAGNERVLRARLADARFFWDQDRKQALADFLPKLEAVVFHAKLGTQGGRVQRLERLAALIAPKVGADPALAAQAARLAKADLACGMVGEFPELQGVMGRYYALAEGLDARVAEAIGAHYRPMGPGDAVPDEPVAIAVALADKLDLLAGFFAVGEKPTGSGDPFALRRAGLGVIRIIRENGLRVALGGLLDAAVQEARIAQMAPLADQAATLRAELAEVTGLAQPSTGVMRTGPSTAAVTGEVLEFLLDRLRVQLRAEGARHDLVAASFGATPDDDLTRLLARAEALERLLATPDGANLLAAARRAANILRIETRKDGPHTGPVEAGLLAAPAEARLAEAVAGAAAAVAASLEAEDFPAAMRHLAALRAPLDAFFEEVVVNDPDPALRRNRLRLLASLSATMARVADFPKIEG